MLRQVTLLLGVLLLIQSVWIVLLMVRHRRRRAADREHYADVTHAARVSVIGEITAAIVHEVTQPLSAILSNVETAELLLQSPNPKLAAVLEILTDVRHDDLRAYDIVKALRSFLKKRDLSFERVEINALVSNAVAMVQPDAMRRGIVIDTSLGENIPALLADPVHLQQVLLNLIINAMEAMHDTPPSERWIEVHTRMQGTAVLVEVVDNGPGVRAEHRQKLFDPFFTTKAEGVGMGLALSRSIVTLHGGTLQVENRQRAGAAFTILLPASGPLASSARSHEYARMTLH
jgi:C4-dicarboxylate-specific signal transduction histidine kinase